MKHFTIHKPKVLIILLTIMLCFIGLTATTYSTKCNETNNEIKTPTASNQEISSTALASAGSIVYYDDSTWLVPMTISSISSDFAWRIHPINGQPQFHKALDLPASVNTPIIASHHGYIQSFGYDDSMGYYVQIRSVRSSGDGCYYVTYMHMTHHAGLTKDQVVQAGQVIGYCGSTGSSTGNHLHYQVAIGSRVNADGSFTISEYINPKFVLGLTLKDGEESSYKP